MAATALTIGVPLVFTWVAKLMDKLLGDKTGSVKKETGTQVLQVLMPALQKLLGPSVGLPTAPAEIATLLQSAVDELNAKGELKGAATKIDAAHPTVPTEGVAMMLEGALKVLRGA